MQSQRLTEKSGHINRVAREHWGDNFTPGLMLMMLTFGHYPREVWMKWCISRMNSGCRPQERSADGKPFHLHDGMFTWYVALTLGGDDEDSVLLSPRVACTSTADRDRGRKGNNLSVIGTEFLSHSCLFPGSFNVCTG